MTDIDGNQWPVKNRYLLGILLVSVVIAEIFSIFFTANINYPLSEIVFEYLFYMSMAVVLWILVKKAEINWQLLMGKMKYEFITAKYILIAPVLIFISIGAIFLLYYPMSLISPEFVQTEIIDAEISLFRFEGEYYKLANTLSFLSSVIIAPLIEEIFFRGFLLTSLANKYNIKYAVIISSVLFGFFHTDIIGGIIFGIVLSVLYLKTSSLFLPIIIHICNNIISFIMAYFYLESYTGETKYLLKDFQNALWVGGICFIIGIIWLIFFYKKEISGNRFYIPYFNN